MNLARVFDATSEKNDDVKLVSGNVENGATPRVEVIHAEALPRTALEDAGRDGSSTQKCVARLRVVKPVEYEVKNFSKWEAILQSWEGRVVCDIPEKKEFVAIISDRTTPTNPDEEVVIGYESVLASDRKIIAEGAVFFLNVGRFREVVNAKLGPSKKKFEIRFRRLPGLSQKRAAEIRSESQKVADKLHGN